MRKLLVALLALSPLSASAAVLGDSGIEIEGPQDRRGLAVRPMLSFGAGFADGESRPVGRLTLGIGTGVSQDLVLGLDAGVAGVFDDETSWGLAADLTAQQFFTPNLFLHVGVGTAPVPVGTTDVEVGFGGRVGLGFENWINTTQALGFSLTYDGRFASDQFANQVLAAAYLSWY